MGEPDPEGGCLLQIGEAARRARLTKTTLRFYEVKGLLKPAVRMESGFRLYSAEDMERIERIRQLRDLLGFSLAEIKEMLDAEDVRLQAQAEWRREPELPGKADQVRRACDATAQQIALIDEKMAGMAAMRASLQERLERYRASLGRWGLGDEPEPAHVTG